MVKPPFFHSHSFTCSEQLNPDFGVSNGKCSKLLWWQIQISSFGSAGASIFIKNLFVMTSKVLLGFTSELWLGQSGKYSIPTFSKPSYIFSFMSWSLIQHDKTYCSQKDLSWVVQRKMPACKSAFFSFNCFAVIESNLLR